MRSRFERVGGGGGGGRWYGVAFEDTERELICDLCDL